MSENFTSTKFWLTVFVILISSTFVAFGVGTFDAWAYYTTGIVAIYSGANVVGKSKFIK